MCFLSSHFSIYLPTFVGLSCWKSGFFKGKQGIFVIFIFCFLSFISHPAKQHFFRGPEWWFFFGPGRFFVISFNTEDDAEVDDEGKFVSSFVVCCFWRFCVSRTGGDSRPLSSFFSADFHFYFWYSMYDVIFFSLFSFNISLTLSCNRLNPTNWHLAMSKSKTRIAV